MAQPLLQSMAPRPPSIRLQRGFRRVEGLSLLELLVGMVISIVVLAATVRMVVSLTRDGNATQVELNRKDEVGRVLGLMQDETRSAQRVESGVTLTALSGCSTAPQLILRGATSNEDISYGLLAQAANTTWRGPAVLVRCGPTYNQDGLLNAGTVASPIRSEQVILDSLCTTTTPGCNAQSGFSAITATNNIRRNVEINLNSLVAAARITSSVQVPINTNQVYGLASSGLSGTCPDGSGTVATGCLDPNGLSIHYRPTLGGSTIAGSPSLEDVFYFPLNRSAYSLNRTPGSGLCTTEQCTVREGTTGSSITFSDGDVLIFRDRQIRL